MGDPYDTKLTPEQEKAYEQWVTTLPKQLQSTKDYDLRGAWQSDAKAAANGHLPDTWKKPNHITFSNESIYAKGLDAGRWVDQGNDNWSFRPGSINLKNYTPEQLQEYFKRFEPNSTLLLPNSSEDIKTTIGPR